MGRKTKPQEEKKGKLSISISTENFQIMEIEKINKSKLINWLLSEHFNSLSNG
jgi:hypothetical protein